MSHHLPPAPADVPEGGASVLAGLDLPVAVLDASGRLQELNGAAARWLGAEPDRLTGRELAPLLADAEAVVAAFGRLAAAPALPQTLDVQRAPSPGRDETVPPDAARNVDASARLHLAVFDPREGRIVARWDTAPDREAAERQLQLFADTVAHDLRAPLRSIDSFARLLQSHAGGALDETGQDYLTRIRTAAERMASLLTALGELSRATRNELRPQVVDLSLLAEWTLAELQDADPGRATDLQVQPGLSVQGDERLLRQLLRALLENAWKFSRERDCVRIRLTGRREGAEQVVELADEGIGFDPRYAYKLFQPFQRLHGSEQGAGHGLGLAIAERIVQRHGGRIRAQSDGTGCVITFALPAAAAERLPHA